MRKTIVCFLDAAHRGFGGINSLNEDLLNSRLTSSFEFQRSGLETLLSTKDLFPYVDTSVIVIFDEVLTWRKIPKVFRLRRRMIRWASGGKRRFHFIHREHHYSKEFVRHCVPTPSRFHAMLRLGYSMMDTVLAISGAQARWINETKLAPREKVRFFHQSINIHEFLQVQLPTKPRPDSADGASIGVTNGFVFGVIGRLTFQKGVDVLIAAWNSFAGREDVTLLVAGEGANLEMLRRKSMPYQNIQFIGKVIDRESFYQRCDSIVIPSRYEPFGQVCLEARAAGRPVIVSSADGLPEQVSSGAGMVFDNEDADKLAYALQDLVVSRQTAGGRHEKMCLRARDSAQASWEAFLTEMAMLLREVS